MEFTDIFKVSIRKTCRRAIICCVAAVIAIILSTSPADAADTTQPRLLKAEPTSKQLIYLTFDESVKFVGSPDISLSPVRTINNIQLVSTDARIVRIILTDLLETGNQYPAPLQYTVTVNSGVYDLSDNVLDPAYKSAAFDAFTPHGKYAPYPVTNNNSTRMCGQCHTAHSAVGYNLINRFTIKKVCFVCHGNTGISVYRVEKEFTSWMAGSAYSTSMHKSLDIEDGGNKILTCVDCHDPHGIRRSGADIYSKLLRSKNVYGAVYNSGSNWFCLACHGFGDVNPQYQNRLGAYWNDTRGDHNWGMTSQDGSKPIPHFSTEFPGMVPASGTNVTCVKCHERHGSTWPWLGDHNRADGEEDQCYKCHGKDTNYSMSVGYNVYNLITTSVSKHRVFDTLYGRVECSSCHGPHTVGNAKYVAGKVYSAISDPDNTKNVFITTSGGLSQFCLKCHDSIAPSTASNSATVMVPYNVSFINPGFSTNGGGWNKDAPYSYIASGHYNNTELRSQTDTYGNYKNECSLCHEWHGTPYKWLVRLDEDKSGADGICLQCHQSGTGYTPPASVSSLDVKTPLGNTFAHPTIAVGYAGRHSNTENYYRDAESTTTNRHAQCYDCHDPHTVKNIWASVDDQVYKLGNVSGATFNWSGASWSTWATNATPTGVFLDSTTYKAQAYLCFKCHTKYAYTPAASANGESNVRAPFTTPSDATLYQTDVAREFNPSNKSKHIVLPGFDDTSTAINIPAGYGNFLGYDGVQRSRNTVLKCTDCHGPGSGAQGPHGSANKFILVAKWNPVDPDGGGAEVQTGVSGSSTHLCFKCHDYNFYSTNTATSQFKSSSYANEHGRSNHKLKGCARCHGGLPHGWWRVNASGHGWPLYDTPDPVPYGTGATIPGTINDSSTQGGGVNYTNSGTCGGHFSC